MHTYTILLRNGDTETVRARKAHFGAEFVTFTDEGGNMVAGYRTETLLNVRRDDADAPT